MGQPINVIGRIVDLHGNPIRNAQVDLWQCNAAGRYDHPGDRANPAALDPNFQGFARLATDRDGQFKFRSVKPKDYDTPIGRPDAAHPFRHRRPIRAAGDADVFPGRAAQRQSISC